MDWGRKGIGHTADLVKGREIARHLFPRGKVSKSNPIFYYYYLLLSLVLLLQSLYVFRAGAVSKGKESKNSKKDGEKRNRFPKLTFVWFTLFQGLVRLKQEDHSQKPSGPASRL